MIVVDASVAIKSYVEEPGHTAALVVLRSDEQRIAPDFVLLEVVNVLRRKQRVGTLTNEQLVDAIDLVGRSFDRLVPAKGLLQLSASLSRSLDHSVYDCAYLACALLEGVQLLTADEVFLVKVERSSYAGHIIRLGQ